MIVTNVIFSLMIKADSEYTNEVSMKKSNHINAQNVPLLTKLNIDLQFIC